MICYHVQFLRDLEECNYVQVSAVPVVIGRAPDVDLVLLDERISRRHARMFVEDGRLHIQDLGSRNGVLVNGEPVRSACLDENDSVTVGAYCLLFKRIDNFEAFPAAEAQIPYEAITKLHRHIITNEQATPLTILYRISQVLTSRSTFQGLLRQILEALIKAFPADRCLVLQLDEAQRGIEVVASITRDHSIEEAQFSTTLAQHVLRTRSAVFTNDAEADDRFEASDSIATYNIKAAMCVPLSGTSTYFGVLYLDSASLPPPFRTEDFHLLTILGQMIGVGLENRRFAEDRIHQERLAGIGEAVSGTSHDMRNILTGIKGGAEMLQLAWEAEDFERGQRGMCTMQKAMERFEGLLNDLLTYARKTHLNPQPASVNSLIEEVVDAMTMRTLQAGIAVKYEPKSLNKIDLDCQEMYRVLLNLMENAIDALEGQANAEIQLCAWQNVVGTCISVRDNGVGIPKENLPLISQAFFTTKQSRGTGLGLAVCYSVVEQHGGKIEVQSTPGQGSTFTIHIPRQTINMKRPALEKSSTVR